MSSSVRRQNFNFKIRVEAYSEDYIKLFYNTILLNFYKKPFILEISPLKDQKKKIRKYTLLKSPHVNKKAREQFESRIFRSYFFINLNPLGFLMINKEILTGIVAKSVNPAVALKIDVVYVV